MARSDKCRYKNKFLSCNNTIIVNIRQVVILLGITIQTGAATANNNSANNIILFQIHMYFNGVFMKRRGTGVCLIIHIL